MDEPGSAEPFFPLRSLLTSKASHYSLFILVLAASGECRPWPRPLKNPLKGWTSCPKSLQSESARVPPRSCVATGSSCVLQGNFGGVCANRILRVSSAIFILLVGCEVFSVQYPARLSCIKVAAKQQNYPSSRSIK